MEDRSHREVNWNFALLVILVVASMLLVGAMAQVDAAATLMLFQ